MQPVTPPSVGPQTPGMPPPPQVWPRRAAVAALEQAAAAVAGGAAVDAELGAGLRRAGVDAAADAGRAAAAAGLGRGAGAAVEQAAAAVAGGAAVDAELRRRSAATQPALPPQTLGVPPPPQVCGRGAGAALEEAAAAVAGGAAVDAELRAGLRRAGAARVACAGGAVAADARHAAAAAGLGRRAGAAVDEAAAAVADGPAVDALGRAGGRGARGVAAAHARRAAAAAGLGARCSCRTGGGRRSRRPPGRSWRPASAQVFGMQWLLPPQALSLPPPPQVSGALQLPQLDQRCRSRRPAGRSWRRARCTSAARTGRRRSRRCCPKPPNPLSRKLPPLPPLPPLPVVPVWMPVPVDALPPAPVTLTPRPGVPQADASSAGSPIEKERVKSTAGHLMVLTSSGDRRARRAEGAGAARKQSPGSLQITPRSAG